MGCEMVSVMPHQPMVLMPSALVCGRSLAPVPHRRKWCFSGRGRASSALKKNGMVECQVQRLRTAMSQKRLAENFGISTMLPPTHIEERKE
ncbi:hypothetical protein D3C76_643460 [compost metagenome]